jgi:hypothetical protein
MLFTELIPLAQSGHGIVERRFSAFGPAVIENGESIFNEFFGLGPDTTVINRAKFMSNFTRTKNGVKWAVTITPLRIDVGVSFDEAPPVPILATPADLDAAKQRGKFADFLAIPDDAAARESFHQSCLALVGRMEGLSRLAISEHVLWNADSKEASSERLAKLLPKLEIDPATASDLFYRINRRRNPNVLGTEVAINRLAEWFSLTLVGVNPNSPNVPILLHAPAVRTDINTALEQNLEGATKDLIAAIASILFEFSAELIEKGDTP